MILRNRMIVVSMVTILSCVTILSGCVGGDRYYFVSRDFKGQDVSIYIKDHYPPGSDEKSLISEFTAEGYLYLPPTGQNQKRRLVYPKKCPPSFYDMGQEIYIAWLADGKGMITEMEEARVLSCGEIYP